MNPVRIEEATPSDFDSKVFEPKGELVVVDFWGPDCPNCDFFASQAEALLSELPGDKVKVVKVNAYEHEKLAERFGLFGIPTFILVRDGRVIGKMSEYRGRDFWLGVVRDHLPA